jgi:tRNA uridine 5-carbamoylmethylation protein Kti12
VKEVARKVRLLASPNVDSISINRDRYFHNAYTIDLPLDSMPDHIWQDIFEKEWKSSRHLWDRKLFIVGDKLRLATTVDDLEDKLDWISQIIERTNKDVEEYNQETEARETQVEEDARRRTAEGDRVSVDTIRDTIRKRLGTI